MRSDMAKVIVERPRIKPRNERKSRGRAGDLDDLPAYESMRRRHLHWEESKSLNENLAPLRRYLAGQVGRPWNKIYSEISEHLRVDNMVQQHVRDHLHDFVAITPRRDINTWCWGSTRGPWPQEFYVNPATGLLCRTDQLPELKAARRAPQNRRAHAPDRIAFAEDHELRCINGIWYDLRLAPLPKPIYRTSRETVRVHLKRPGYSPFVDLEMDVRYLVSPPVRDAATGRMIPVGPSTDTVGDRMIYRRHYPDRRYAVTKQALSRRDLRRHGLSNEVNPMTTN